MKGVVFMTLGHLTASGTTTGALRGAALISDRELSDYLAGEVFDLRCAKLRHDAQCRNENVKSPSKLGDLQFAAELRALAEDDGDGPGVLEIDGDYDRVLFPGSSFTDADAGGARFTECAFTGGGFDGGRLRRARLSDVWFGETRLVAVDMAESSLTDTWFSGCVFAGVQAFSWVARRVLFRGCKLDSVNFRDGKLTDVTFEDCVLRDVDFATAKLARVRFTGSTLVGADFTRVECKDVDLRGARLGSDTVPGIKAGYDSLSGTRIDSLQLMTIAPLLAQHLGIRVTD
jgi:uncharacterized protein YjbI with pentapeptide repeats